MEGVNLRYTVNTFVNVTMYPPRTTIKYTDRKKEKHLEGARHMPVILATQEADIRRILFQGQPKQIVHETLFGNYPTQKRTGRVAQVVECLLSKCEALSLNTSHSKKSTLKKVKLCLY
jgi:hypothetical protein